MAKYRIKASLITPLTDAGFIDGSGDMTVTFVARVQGETESHYKLTFAAATDIIETTNEGMIEAIETLSAPGVKVDGSWLVGDPTTTQYFETVPDADPNPTIDPAASGTAQVTAKDKNLAVRYGNMSKDGPIPPGRDKTTLQPWVDKARNYFRGRKL
jgi:hypothetical protein